MKQFKTIPKHIAIVMDGNGRWAKKHFFKRVIGHRYGIDALRNVVRECSNLGVHTLTVFAFSEENWNRPASEVASLMKLMRDYLIKEREPLHKKNIKISAIGNLEKLPQEVQLELKKSKELTKNNTKMNFILAVSYSGRSEIIRATKAMVRDVKNHKLDSDTINEETFSRYLDTKGHPDPDLFIRTSGEVRISNFLLWQIAYSEIYITKTLWPDFTLLELHKAIEDYGKRERRFGLVKENNNE